MIIASEIFFSHSLTRDSEKILTQNQHQRRLIILTSKIMKNFVCCSKVSQRKISSKRRSDKCVHCEAKVELDKLKEFVTCTGKIAFWLNVSKCFEFESLAGCEELACHNQKCSEFIFELGVWECARCQKNR